MSGGNKTEPDAELPYTPDPPIDEDEWGAEVGFLSGNGSLVPEDDKLRDLKRCLVDSLYGRELGLRETLEDRAEILELVNQLEAANPTKAPTEAPDLLDGNWILLYTAFAELSPLLAMGATPFLKVKRISQVIDSKTLEVVNATTLSSPFATFSFSSTASFEVQTSSRIQHILEAVTLSERDIGFETEVQFKEGIFQPPEISSSLDLPETVDIFGQKINLQPVQQTLNPIQEAAANITRSISGQPPLKFPLPGNRAASWLLKTYLNQDFRISRMGVCLSSQKRKVLCWISYHKALVT
ncbi:hypothetical protein ZIOFF_050991 [Zingiber officinale]|uniref:Plastid lipid-associated protein/fibrillin conserved domain-containing protein n=1 Tax=Zingiber officinale TaxID=94328 RepID=A0A8J5FJS4_ZINOF|nr:hypothetical protein ZIOFF_050991 [Zingiber officinale]